MSTVVRCLYLALDYRHQLGLVQYIGKEESVKVCTSTGTVRHGPSMTVRSVSSLIGSAASLAQTL